MCVSNHRFPLHFRGRSSNGNVHAGVEKCYVVAGKHAGDPPVVQTEGVNLGAMWEHDDLLDSTRVTTNDVAATLKTLGVEAARTTLVQEVVGLFSAYGIAVNARHLNLIADFMTQQVRFRGDTASRPPSLPPTLHLSPSLPPSLPPALPPGLPRAIPPSLLSSGPPWLTVQSTVCVRPLVVGGADAPATETPLFPSHTCPPISKKCCSESSMCHAYYRLLLRAAQMPGL
jgi:RNA polymerase Rpb1, domain 5